MSSGWQGGNRAIVVLHLAMVLGVVVMATMFTVVRMTGFVTYPHLLGALRLAGFAVLGAALLVSWRIRARVTARSAGEEWSAWWAQNGGRALVLWATAEGTAGTGLVFWLLTGDVWLLVALTGWGVVSLLVTAPRRLAEV